MKGNGAGTATARQRHTTAQVTATATSRRRNQRRRNQRRGATNGAGTNGAGTRPGKIKYLFSVGPPILICWLAYVGPMSARRSRPDVATGWTIWDCSICRTIRAPLR